MKRQYAILAIIISLFLFNCKNLKSSDNNVESQTISSGLKKANITNAKKWLVILPGLGCNGCIQEGEVFMRDYVDSTNIFFVLTKVQSLKILQQKVGKNLRNLTNVYIDKNEIFNLPTKNGIYLCIVHLKDGKVVSHQFQSPSNSQAFEWLKSKLD